LNPQKLLVKTPAVFSVHNPQIHLGGTSVVDIIPQSGSPLGAKDGELLQSFGGCAYASPSCTGCYAPDSQNRLVMLYEMLNCQITSRRATRSNFPPKNLLVQTPASPLQMQAAPTAERGVAVL